MQRVYTGGVFSDTLPDGRAGGDVELLPLGIAIRCPSGESFRVLYRECQLETGGHHGKMIFCRNRDRSLTIFSDSAQFRRDLSRAAAGILDEQLALGQQQRRVVSRRNWFYASAILVAMLTCVLAGYFGIRSAAKAAVRALPTRIDVQIGNAAMSSMNLEGPTVDDEVILGAMQTIVDRLTPAAAVQGLEFKVHVIDSTMVNAFALPGGNIVVYTGLIRRAETPDQVAAVLAHEMAHVTLRHGLQRIAQSLGMWAGMAMVFGDMSGFLGAGAELFQTASGNHYSRDQENEADREGVHMLNASDVDPAAMRQFFSIIAKEHGDLPGFFPWISTHPDEASRMSHVDTLIAKLPPQEYRPIHVDWIEVQAHLQDLPTRPAQDQ